MQNYTGYGWEGKNYNNNLSTTDIAKIIRQQLKKEYPNCKFSIRSEYYSMGSSIHICLISAPFEVFPDNVPDLDHPVAEINRFAGYLKEAREKGYTQLNQYQFKYNWKDEQINNCTPLTEKVWSCMKRVYQIATEYNYDDSDAQIDYFSTNFYLHLNIGKWNKPFVVLP